MSRFFVLAVAVLALVIGLPYLPSSIDLGSRLSTDPSAASAPPTPERRLLDAASVVCPGPEQQGLADSAVEELEQRVDLQALAAPDAALPSAAQDTLVVDGELSLRELDTTNIVTTAERGAMIAADVDDARAVVLSGRDGLAPGLGAVQVYRGDQEQRFGLSLTQCVPASEESWLIAGGDGVGRAERLVLVNPGQGPVEALVSVLEAGAEPLPEDRAAEPTRLTLAPGTREILLLDALAPGAASPVLQVTSTGGPVTAYLGDRWLEGSTDAGMELTGPVAGPATVQLIGGLPETSPADDADDSGAEVSTLSVRVAAPGPNPAGVTVQALTDDGATRVDIDITVVPPRSSVDIEVGDLPTGARGLQVTSDVPVVAAAQYRSAPDDLGNRDLAWAPGMSALSSLGGTSLPQPGGPDADDDPSVEYVLEVVSALGGTATVLTQDASGSRDSRTINLVAGSTMSQDIDAAVAVWVRPTSGDIRAAVRGQSTVTPQESSADGDARASAQPRGSDERRTELVTIIALTDAPVFGAVLGLIPRLP